MKHHEVRFGEFKLDVMERQLSREGMPVRLGSRALDILCVLASARGETVSKSELIKRVWSDVVVEEGVIPVHISSLRRTLDQMTKDQSYIITVPGRGYRLIGIDRVIHDRAQIALSIPDASIAVLPFENMSADPQQDYFAGGVVEDIIVRLSRIKWLFVIASGSSSNYKHRPIDVRQAGKELGVRYLLDGTVRKSEERLRATTKLIEAETGLIVWAERYDRILGDIFAVQDDIAMSVVGAIEPRLRRLAIDIVKRKREAMFNAYDLVLRALPYMHDFMTEGTQTAIPLLQQALAIDPDYSEAHALLARCFHFRFSRGGLQEEDRLEAVHHARSAILGGTDDSTTLAIAAIVLWFDAHDITTAFELFDRALTISNSNVVALGTSAFALAWMGDTERAVERASRALRLSPFDTLNAYLALAIANFHARRYSEAQEMARRGAELHPSSSIPHILYALALMRSGRHSEAQKEAQKAVALDPTFTMARWSTTVGVMPNVFAHFAEAWAEI